jgi:hypothetical protein
MEKTAYDAYKYSFISVSVFGILSNIVVLISIFRQRSLLKNNYYFLVSQLAINDLGGLIIYLLNHIDAHYIHWVEGRLDTHSILFCLFGHKIYHFFQCTGIGMPYDVSHYSASLSCYRTSLKTCHQSTEIESRLWFGVHCWFYCWLWNRSAVVFHAAEWQSCDENSLCIRNNRLHFGSNNIHDCSLLQNRPSTRRAKQTHEACMFQRSKEETFSWSTNISCLSQHRSLLRSWKFANICVEYMVHRRRI